MTQVVCALIPGLIVSIYFFGFAIFTLVLVAIGTAIVTEVVFTRSIKTIRDGSAIVTGFLIGLCLPATTPLFIPALAAGLGIVVGKLLYGGLGKNIFNPAMVGYAIVLVAYPVHLTYYDSVTGATALEFVTLGRNGSFEQLSSNAALGWMGASTFEWINVAFLAGGLYLLAVRIVRWSIPAGVLLGLGLPALIVGLFSEHQGLNAPIFHWFAGATMISAFFIATDPVTSPSTVLHQFLYGVFIGLMTFVIRAFGSWPDGFAFAVLLANMLLPLLIRSTTTSVQPRS